MITHISASDAQTIIDMPGVTETFYGGRKIPLPDDENVVYLGVPGGVLIFSPLNFVTHVVHAAFRPGERKYSGLVVRAALERFRAEGGQKVIAFIPRIHRAAVGLAWNSGFRRCGSIPGGCEHGDLLIFEDHVWDQSQPS